MAVTDLMFLFWFIPGALLVYYITRGKCREYVLLAVSLFFYACGAPDYLFLLLLSLIINIFTGYLIAHFREKIRVARFLLAMGVIYNLAILFFFKYFDFVMLNLSKVFQQNYVSQNLLLPLGLSFFTFKAISYLIDTYTGKIEVNNGVVKAALYMSFFAQMQSGPLSRYNDMFGRKDKCQEGRFSLFSEGVYRFVIGFNKKILLANTLANITQEAFDWGIKGELSTGFAWFGAVCYSMQLFFDFSGYSDMAIGISQMFGYRCPENFNYPYMTSSVSKFWHRWHITLGAWFRDYVYIPLGGSRVDTKFKLYRNLFVVWFLTGMWHGANWQFIFWGVTYFCVIAIEKTFDWPNRFKLRFVRILYRLCVIVFVIFEWVIFRADGLKAGLEYAKVMILNTPNSLADLRGIFLLKDNLVFVIVGILLCFPIMPVIEKYLKKTEASTVIWNIGILANVLLFLCAISFVVAGQNNPFAYANF